MKLVYSTNDLATANELTGALEAVGVSVHLAGEHVARLPGFGARLTPNALGVWILDESQMDRVVKVLNERNLVPVSDSATKTTHQSGFWVKIGIVLVIALGVILAIKL